MEIKNNRGITLIILVITIIVVLILSGILILSTIEDGTIKQTQNVVDLNNNLINKIKDNEENLQKHNVVNFMVE